MQLTLGFITFIGVFAGFAIFGRSSHVSTFRKWLMLEGDRVGGIPRTTAGARCVVNRCLVVSVVVMTLLFSDVLKGYDPVQLYSLHDFISGDVCSANMRSGHV
jgi:hypothetical protein